MNKYLYPLILIALFVIPFNLSAQKTYTFYSEQIHKPFEHFTGGWNVIFSGYTESGSPSGGRGTAEIELEYQKSVLVIENKLNYQLGMVFSKYIIAYDKYKQQYYILSYNNSGGGAFVLYGDYDKDNNKFEFTDYSEEPKNQEQRIVIKVERNDKFIMNHYKIKEKEEILFLEFGFIKKK